MKIFKPREEFYLRINKNEVINLLPPAIIIGSFAIILIVLTEVGILNLW